MSCMCGDTDECEASNLYDAALASINAIKQGEPEIALLYLRSATMNAGNEVDVERLKRSVNDGLEPIGDVIRSIFSDDIQRRHAERDEIASEARIEKQLGDVNTDDESVSDRNTGPIEFSESPEGEAAKERWAERYADLDGAPEGEWDR